MTFLYFLNILLTFLLSICVIRNNTRISIPAIRSLSIYMCKQFECSIINYLEYFRQTTFYFWLIYMHIPSSRKIR